MAVYVRSPSIEVFFGTELMLQTQDAASGLPLLDCHVRSTDRFAPGLQRPATTSGLPLPAQEPAKPLGHLFLRHIFAALSCLFAACYGVCKTVVVIEIPLYNLLV